MTFRRWTLSTLDGSETYTLQINPQSMESPFPVRAVEWEWNGPRLGWSGRRAGRTPKQWSFSGVLRSEEQYNDLLAWVGKSHKIQLTDDRGDQFLIRLLEFKPTQTGSSRSRIVPWRMTYTMQAQVYAALGQMFDSDKLVATERAAITPKGTEGGTAKTESAVIKQLIGAVENFTGVDTDALRTAVRGSETSAGNDALAGRARNATDTGTSTTEGGSKVVGP